MTLSQLTQAPIAKTEMLIRKPVADVFEAFVDPAITSKFWFTKGSGRLEAGKEVQWEWEMYNLSTLVNVKEVELNERILVEWFSGGSSTIIEWTFTQHTDHTTMVKITNAGFSGDGDEIVQQAIGSTEGFTFVLAGLKALFEHNINLNLVADRFPNGIPLQ
jgi:uncharacterized protein YndB with AHSA1/START domain